MIDAVFLGTMIPLLFLIILLKGESRMMMLFFAWGMVAFAMSHNVNDMLSEYLDISISELSVSWAPIVEELLKALPLLYFLLKRTQAKYPIIYFAMSIGIGFSIQENYLYLLQVSEIENSLAFYVLMRSITTCLMHGISTSIIGYGLDIIRRSKIMVAPLLFGLLSLSVILHALFNLYTNSDVRLIGMLMPILLYIISLVVLYEDKDNNKMAFEGEKAV